MTLCVPGQEPVASAVQPGGVSVGKTPIIGRWTPRFMSCSRWGMCPQFTMLATNSMLAPSIPMTITFFAGLLILFSVLF